ncbi:MAG: T9SS type A sorting domain-containing protein [Bacteroidetes bacterium]|nr:T9SS type A sorting domain-containing protein [Bacteroidota bacterium]
MNIFLRHERTTLYQHTTLAPAWVSVFPFKRNFIKCFLVLSIFFVVIIQNISAQPYFNKSYNPLNAYEMINGLAFKDGKTIACGISGFNKVNDSTYSYLSNLQIFLFDSSYNSIQSKINLYDSLYHYAMGFGNSTPTYFDINSILFTKFIDTSNNINYRFHYNYILKYDADSFKYEIIPINLPYPKKANVFFAIRPTNDYYFISGGSTFNQYANVFAARMDTLGNINWIKEYGNENYLGKMQLVDNNKLLLLGGNKSASLWISELDSIGNVLWERSYHNDSIYFYSAFNSSLQCNNSIYAAGFNSNNRWGNRKDYLQRCFLTKLDANGKTIWEKNYLFATDTNRLASSGFNQILVKNNYIYALGVKDTSYTKTTSNKVAFLTKIDTLGNVQWYQIYNKTYGGDNELYSIYDKEDGFMMCGYVDDTSHLGYAQREVYPNPAKDILHINWSYAVKGKMSLYLYSNQAQELYKGMLHKENTIKLNDLNLKAGLYWVLIHDGTSSFYKKVIIE